MAHYHRRHFPSRLDQVGEARRYVDEHLGACPVREDAVLLTSEVVTNAVTATTETNGNDGDRTGSGFDVNVEVERTRVRILVTDRATGGTPCAQSLANPHDLDGLSESGRGLGLVGLIAEDWGHASNGHGHDVWFELSWA